MEAQAEYIGKVNKTPFKPKVLIKKIDSSEPEKDNPHTRDGAKVPQIQAFSTKGTLQLEWYPIVWESLPCLYFVVDAKGIVFSVSQCGVSHLGYTKHELISQPIFRIFSSEDRDRVQEEFFAFAQQSNSAAPSTSALTAARITCKNDSILPVKAIARTLPPLSDEKFWKQQEFPSTNYQLPLILLTCEDVYLPISEAQTNSKTNSIGKLAEAALERELNLFASGPVTLFRWKPKENWLVEYVSPNVAQFGYQASECIGGKLVYTDIVHPDDRARIATELQSYIEAGATSFEQNYRIVKKDGLSRWVYSFISVVRSSNNQISHADGYILDITETKLAQIALHQQAEREHLVGQIQARIRSSLDLDAILNTAAAEVRQFLGTDRVIIFRFRPDWSGDVVVESVGAESMTILNRNIYDPCFVETYVQQYQAGRIRATDDIYTAGLSECHLNFLMSCQVRANLVVPIIQNDQQSQNLPSSSLVKGEDKIPNSLWGLLIAHHCTDSRQWQPWETELLKQLATQIAIAIEQSQLYEQLAVANQELQNLASLDGLTKIANRRRFDEVLTQEWQRLKVEPIRLSLILCDIDCFKTYNDTYGHLAGDACLQQVATAIRDACGNFPPERVYFVARYGGEEFAVILPNTDIDDAIAVAGEIRQRVKTLAIPHQKSFVCEYVTLSLGVASADATKGVPETLIAAADKALYEAKSQGRDRVVSAAQEKG